MKINCPTSMTNPISIAPLLDVVKTNGTLKSNEARTKYFPEVRSVISRWNPNKPDTHSEGQLKQYGLIEYVSGTTEGEFYLSFLGERFLELFSKGSDGQFSRKENTDYEYNAVLIDCLLTWEISVDSTVLHPGLLLLKLMIDERLKGYLFEHEWVYVCNSDFANDSDYEQLVSSIVYFREAGIEPPPSPAGNTYAFLISFSNSWGIFDKEVVENKNKFLLRKITKENLRSKLQEKSTLSNEEHGIITKGLKNETVECIDYDRVERIPGGKNIIFYGVPGSGKSWTMDHEYCNENAIIERLVFHPDYTNADFIGQILPVVDKDKQVTYEFTPGPFTLIMREAYTHPDKEYLLVIEEVNRGNAPAIFGEVFQLLDRLVVDDARSGYPAGSSEYGITHKYMAELIYKDENHKVRIPSNLSILGTMNTSDQNVFTLDTAFQRRWQMRLIENSFDNVRAELANAEILDTKVSWKKFCETVNSIIVGNRAKMASAEDKRLGVYFIHESTISFDQRAVPSNGFNTLLSECESLKKGERDGNISAEGKKRLSEIREALMHNRMFPEKVIKYLWDDAFKFNPEALFDTSTMESLEHVIRTFVFSEGKERFKVLKKEVRDTLCPAEATNTNLQ